MPLGVVLPLTCLSCCLLHPLLTELLRQQMATPYALTLLEPIPLVHQWLLHGLRLVAAAVAPQRYVQAPHKIEGPADNQAKCDWM